MDKSFQHYNQSNIDEIKSPPGSDFGRRNLKFNLSKTHVFPDGTEKMKKEKIYVRASTNLPSNDSQ